MSPQAPDNPPASTEVRLEALKILQTAAAMRWEKRRQYEWNLSYAVWGALAAFIAGTIFGKDTFFRGWPFVWVGAGLILTSGIYGAYLWFIVRGTTLDLDDQFETENELRTLAGISQFSPDRFLTKPTGRGAWRKIRRWHGVFFQTLLTLLLACCALFVFKTRVDTTLTTLAEEHRGATVVGTPPCINCTQTFATVPPSPPPPDLPADGRKLRQMIKQR